MEEILSAVVDALTILFFIVLFVCYYISFDKCFRKNGESRIKLFFLTLITNPGVYFVSSLILVSVLIRTLFYGLFDYVKGQNAPSVIILLMEIVPVTDRTHGSVRPYIQQVFRKMDKRAGHIPEPDVLFGIFAFVEYARHRCAVFVSDNKKYRLHCRWCVQRLYAPAVL